MQDIVVAIKDKKELRSISDAYVKGRVEEFFEEHPGFKEMHDKTPEKFLKSKDFKAMLKDIRATLREVYGVFFRKQYKDIGKALEELKKNPGVESHKKILEMHKSSLERLPYYEEIYEKMFSITGKPKKIMDLACGLNPFSYPFLGCKPEYIASDISPEMCAYFNEYFDIAKIKGQAFVFNLLDFKKTEMTGFAECDVVFLFKALDSIETIKRDFSENIIKGIPARHIVVSFPTKSIGGGKSIRQERRTWFEKILENNGYEYELFHIENESFYVIKK